MARDLTAGVITELSASRVRPILFVEVEFSSGFVRFWSGIGDFTWDSKLWTGAGNLLSVTPAGETTTVRANGITMSLSGINPAVLSAVLANAQQGKPATCWLGFLDASDEIVADPYLFFKGRVDVPEIEEGPETATVTITAESQLIELRKVRPRRYTGQDQKIDYPTDLGFDFIPHLKSWNGIWGKASSNTRYYPKPPAPVMNNPGN